MLDSRGQEGGGYQQQAPRQNQAPQQAQQQAPQAQQQAPQQAQQAPQDMGGSFDDDIPF
jgi:single-strand DNA-binding protein